MKTLDIRDTAILELDIMDIPSNCVIVISGRKAK